MTEREYVCAHCGGEYASDRSEESTRAEARELFEGIVFEGDEVGVLCEDCWPEFMAWMHATYGPPPWPVPPS